MLAVRDLWERGRKLLVTRDELDDRFAALTAGPLKELKAQIDKITNKKPPYYDQHKLFTYYVDKEFSIEQRKWFIEKHCMRTLKYFPNIDNPRSFNEKTQWYKLYYHDPMMTDFIDKYKFKSLVSEMVGERYVTPLLGVWDNAREIDFNSLPKQFVLKSNWGSGSRHVTLVRDKSKLNIDQTRMNLNNWIQPWENVYYHTFDWGYRNIPPKIIAEELIKDKILEYKFFCFNGEPTYLYVAGDSAPGSVNTHNYYDMDWNLLPFKRHSQNADFPISKPDNFDEMVSLAKTLSKQFPQVRVDFCQTKRGLLVEELTFYVGSGTGGFNPREWDYKFGEAFVLPEKLVIDG